MLRWLGRRRLRSLLLRWLLRLGRRLRGLLLLRDSGGIPLAQHVAIKTNISLRPNLQTACMKTAEVIYARCHDEVAVVAITVLIPNECPIGLRIDRSNLQQNCARYHHHTKRHDDAIFVRGGCWHAVAILHHPPDGALVEYCKLSLAVQTPLTTQRHIFLAPTNHGLPVDISPGVVLGTISVNAIDDILLPNNLHQMTLQVDIKLDHEIVVVWEILYAIEM